VPKHEAVGRQEASEEHRFGGQGRGERERPAQPLVQQAQDQHLAAEGDHAQQEPADELARAGR